jgi:hypothetical protein
MASSSLFVMGGHQTHRPNRLHDIVAKAIDQAGHISGGVRHVHGVKKWEAAIPGTGSKGARSL